MAHDASSGPRPGPVRRLVAFLWQRDERPAVSRAARAADAAVATAATIAAVVTVIMQTRTSGAYAVFPASLGAPEVVHFEPGPGPSPLLLLGVALTMAPLAFRRIYPITVFGVILVAIIATSGHATSIQFAALIFAAYSAAAYSPFRRLALLGVLGAAIIVTAAYPNTSPPVPARLGALLVLLPTVSVAIAIRIWRRRAGESAERLRLAEAEHEAQTRRAVALERARIASEMHDVVTHNVSVMVIQAGAARRVLDSSPGDAREALLAVEASGRTAMTELRHLLGLLASPGAGHEGAAEGSAPDMTLAPQPGVARIPALVARLRAAGMPVELSVEIPGGTPPDLPPGVDLAAFRVVQEGLTNVMKHAGQARTAVRLDHGPREVRITVADDGRPAAGGPRTGPGERAEPGPGPGSGGRGLIGLRERIAVYGGELDAGPRPNGGWRLAARIPLEPAARAGPVAGVEAGGGDVPVPPRFQAATWA